MPKKSSSTPGPKSSGEKDASKKAGGEAPPTQVNQQINIIQNSKIAPIYQDMYFQQQNQPESGHSSNKGHSPTEAKEEKQDSKFLSTLSNALAANPNQFNEKKEEGQVIGLNHSHSFGTRKPTENLFGRGSFT